MSGLARRLQLLMGRAALKLLLKSGAVQVELAGGELRDAERLQAFGLATRPPVDSKALVLFPAGDRARGVAVVIGDNGDKASSLEDGEVRIYNDHGADLLLKADGTVVINASKVEVSGTLKANEIEDASGKLSELRSQYQSHTHTGNQGAPTSPPTA